MAKDKKNSKGPKDRNSNYQMKNGNSVSKNKEKKSNASKPVEKKSAPNEAPGGQKSFISGISSSISSGITKMLKH